MAQAFLTDPGTPELKDRVVDKIVLRADGCWDWLGPHDRDGYGQISLQSPETGRDTTIRAHRFIYLWLAGPIPDGLVIDHLCRNRGCLNPSHMDVVTVMENNRRGLKGRLATVCPHGHAYTPETTIVNKTGHRSCRVCKRIYDRSRSKARRS